MRARRVQSLLLGLTIILLALPLSAAAQKYPERPIRLIVPYPPGGSTDILARAVAPRLSEAWHQPVIIDNRPGAAGNIGNDIAAKAPPDGYTVVVTSMSTAISMTYYRKLPYDVVTDLRGVNLFATQANVLAAASNLPARSMQELIALAKAKPGQIGYASAGSGSSQHLMGELLKQSMKIDLIHVPYKGIGIAINDLVGGQIGLLFSPLASAAPHLKSGRIRALAVTSPKRNAAVPDVPTMIESGVPNYDVVSWYGLHTAAKVPSPIVAKLNHEINRIMALPEVGDRLSALGMDPTPITPERFDALVKSEVERWAKVIKAAGILQE